MKILSLANPVRIREHGSHGASVVQLLRHENLLQIVAIEIEPAGMLGVHPAAVDQLFIVVNGEGEAVEGTGKRAPIQAGQAVLWEAGELHGVAAGQKGLRAIVVEGPHLSQSVQGWL